MSIKTIAVNSEVYDRLAKIRRRGESFSKAIDRLLSEAASEHTGRDILRRLNDVTPLSDEDAGAFLAVVAENRAAERWESHDLR
jgi:predicted CopG family antitoxin